MTSHSMCRYCPGCQVPWALEKTLVISHPLTKSYPKSSNLHGLYSPQWKVMNVHNKLFLKYPYWNNLPRDDVVQLQSWASYRTAVHQIHQNNPFSIFTDNKLYLNINILNLTFSSNGRFLRNKYPLKFQTKILLLLKKFKQNLRNVYTQEFIESFICLLF